jgi:hypothetical protein
VRTLAGILIALALIVGAAFVAFFVPRFTDAYVALEATETAYPVRGATPNACASRTRWPRTSRRAD